MSTITPSTPISYYPLTQPPSHKPPQFRKSQLLRSYASLLRSTPLMLLCQHNNLKSTEWMGIRRELNKALLKTDDVVRGQSTDDGRQMGVEEGVIGRGVKVQIIQTSIFEAALRVVEFFHPEEYLQTTESSTSDIPNSSPTPSSPIYTHTLSRTAHTHLDSLEPTSKPSKRLPLALKPLLAGPLVLITFPSVSPLYLKTVLSILAPSPPAFPAPTRRANPDYHDPAVQAGIHKLLLLGARVEGRVFDTEGTRWVGGIEGGMDGLRSTLVRVLQGVGQQVTTVLEGSGRSLYFALEGRRGMLEDEGKSKEEGKEKAKEVDKESV
ncbi:MAG: hypothetical protein M1817_001614 [Caeruleum heppii]|nr:MAG: hypothetical protein M1817_001614 [Caeruleum heppii]